MGRASLRTPRSQTLIVFPLKDASYLTYNMPFGDSFISNHGLFDVLRIRNNLVATEQERLNKKVLGQDMINPMMWMTMMDIAKNHNILFRVDKSL